MLKPVLLKVEDQVDEKLAAAANKAEKVGGKKAGAMFVSPDNKKKTY